MLVALNQSPIDGGLSQASSTGNPAKLPSVTTSTIIFHNTTSHRSESEDGMSTLETVACSSDGSTNVSEPETRSESAKVGEELV